MTVRLADPSADEWTEASTHRATGISIKRLFQRDGEGTSFEFNVVNFEGENFFSPRHRHNFDQIRIGLGGTMDYGGKKLTGRTIGYFPEGTFYGPLRVPEPSQQAIIQFDGASRCGYVNYVPLDKATAELRNEGEFKNGFFHPLDGGPAIDAYQASWERAAGRAMEYPAPRFTEAIYLHIDSFGWIATSNPGVHRKSLVIAGERGTSLEMAKLESGSSMSIGSTGRTTLAFVLEGEASVEGEPLRRWAAAQSEDDTIDLVGVADETEVVLITLPQFAS